MANELTQQELDFIQKLPMPPISGVIRTSNVWIIEWLDKNEQHTGRELFEWIEKQRRGWAKYFYCQSTTDVINAIECAAIVAEQSNIIPVLHIEAHGNDEGLSNSENGSQFICWDELIVPFQRVNVATRCNLVVVVAACKSFAGIEALTRGPRAPAFAFIGLYPKLCLGELLNGTKELYRRWRDSNPNLIDVVESASRQLRGDAEFVCQFFLSFAYEAQIDILVKSMRAGEGAKYKERLRRGLEENSTLSPTEIEARLQDWPEIPPWEHRQKIWNEMFMIDLEPVNQERFGLDWQAILNQVREYVATTGTS